MAIRTIRPFPLRSQGLAQDDFSTGVENSLTDISGMAADFNAAATVAQLATTTTSSSSVLIGTGAKTFTIPAGLGFVAGMTIRIANSSTAYMTADVTSYSSTTLVVNSTAVIGSGTFASWSISLAAVGANTAGAVSFTPAGNIASVNVQAAIEELDSEKLSNAAGAVTGTNLASIITAGSAGNSFNIPSFTHDAKGRLTIVSQSAKIVSGTAIATTSGTTHTFSAISTSAKRITVNFNAVSTNGASPIQVQIGVTTIDATGYDSTGFSVGTAGSTAASSTTGFLVNGVSVAAETYTGSMIICLHSGNIYVSSMTGRRATNGMIMSAGNKTLAGALDILRITTVGGVDTFDGGSINILVE